jgi:hypothetical protein
MYADDVNLLSRNIEALSDVIKEICLEPNTEKTKYSLVSQQQIVGQNHTIKTANKSYGNVLSSNIW